MRNSCTFCYRSRFGGTGDDGEERYHTLGKLVLWNRNMGQQSLGNDTRFTAMQLVTHVDNTIRIRHFPI